MPYSLVNLVIEPSYVFENYMTVDGRFLIRNDVIFDLKEQNEIGNIFSINNLKLLFENINIKNSALIDKIKDVLYNKKISLVEVRSEIIKNKELILEQDISTNTDEPQTTQNDTNHGLIAKGVLYIARKLKSLLWSVGGMVVDAFLVASGIGKSVQWIPWAIVFCLDIYEWHSGDYGDDIEFKNDSTIWKGLTLGFDILGLISAGAFSKVTRELFLPRRGLGTEGEVASWVAKNPEAKSALQKIYGALSGVSGKLDQAAEYLKTMPTLVQWLVNILTIVPRFISWLGKLLWRILSIPGKIAYNVGNAVQGSSLVGKNIGSGLRAAVNTRGVLGGISLLGGNNNNLSMALSKAGAGEYTDGVDY